MNTINLSIQDNFAPKNEILNKEKTEETAEKKAAEQIDYAAKEAKSTNSIEEFVAKNVDAKKEEKIESEDPITKQKKPEEQKIDQDPNQMEINNYSSPFLNNNDTSSIQNSTTEFKA